MSSEPPTRPLPRHRSVWLSRLRWRWPLLVWFGVLALVFWLYDHGGEYIRINAVVEVITESVAPMKTGRLIGVDVLQGQQVEAGQVVARMDTGFLEEELAVLSERIQQQRAEDERQYLSAKQRLQGDLREHEMDFSEAEIRSRLYGAELQRLEELAERNLVRREDVVEIRARKDLAENRLQQLPGIIGNLRDELDELEALRSRILSEHSAEENGLPHTRLSLLRREIENMTLRAQQAGVVSRIRREPGEIVDAGEKVLDIITRKPPRILAFMSESDTRPVAVGDVVQVERAIEQDRFRARITGLSPNVISLPDRASPIPDRVVRGRRLELVPIDEVKLTPGATMVVILPRNRVFWKDLIGGGLE